MPRLQSDILKQRNPEDLKILLEKLAIYIGKTGGVDHFDSVTRYLINNALSYYKKIDKLSQEEINIIWLSASSLVKKLLNENVNDIIDSENDKRNSEDKNMLIGKYWIFEKGPSYIKCDNHLDFLSKNASLFIDNLGIDAFDYLHEVNSSGRHINLVLSRGAIMGEFYMEDDKKVGKFQLCQTVLPWLKDTLRNMPIFKSHIRIFDKNEKYVDDKGGIYFQYKRPIEN